MAGINLSIFKNTKNPDGALKFVKFMTSKEQQKTLDKPFTALPVVKGGTVESPTASRRPRRSRNPGDPVRAAPAGAGRGVVRDERRQRREQPGGPGRDPELVTDSSMKAALREAQDKKASSGS